MDEQNNQNVDEQQNIQNEDEKSNSDMTSEEAEQDANSEETGQSNSQPLGNGYNKLASSNKEAFTKGLNENYADRIARNKANLEQARARSRETQKENKDGEKQDKNKLDQAKDKANVLRNQASLLTSKIDSARSNIYKAMHPVEAAKIVAKRKIQQWAIGLIIANFPIIIMIFAIFVIVIVLSTDNIHANDGVTRNQECGFTLSKTSLTVEEYKDKLETYATKNSNFKIFVDNAEDIYQYAKAKNINPELVPIRAQAEGEGTTTGDNNYWGMGCKNGEGLEVCIDYETFEEGYIDFINNIAQYTSLSDMMINYAYIGDYWYNPGSSDVGGCYYADKIYDVTNKPSHVEKACYEKAKICTIDGDKSNCTPTTDEDQKAYAKYQAETYMAQIRLDIFGLSKDEGPCVYTYGNLEELSEYNTFRKLNNDLQVLNRQLNKSEIESLNNYINTEVDKAGYGTGAAVAAAGQALTYGLEQQGYYLQYFWGGGHSGYGDKDSKFIGVNPNWGKTGYVNEVTTGPYLGMDCSGFVSWAIRNGCNPAYASNTTGGMNHGRVIDIKDAKPGDLMLDMDAHVRLVIKNNGDGSLILAEEIGGGKLTGLMFTLWGADSSYDIIDMSSYYQNYCLKARPSQ